MTRLAMLTACAAMLAIAAPAQAAPEISPSEIFDIAISGVGSPYVWGGGCWDPADRNRLGADCSGFVAKCWQVPESSAVTTCSHPYSTYNFYNESTHWDHVDRGTAQPADSFVYRSNGAGHIVLFASGDPWGNSEVYEARGTAYGIVHRTRTFDSSYRVRRRHSLIPDGPPPHPLITLSTAIDTIEGQDRDICTRSGSDGLFDVFTGQSAVERLYVTNEGTAVAGDVVVGIELTSSALHIDHWEIFDDWDGHNCGDDWCPNDSNDHPDNPAHENPGASFVLHLYGLSPGESKMIVLDLTAIAATVGDGAHPEVRVWVRNVRDFYTKDSYDSAPNNVESYQTYNGGDLRVAARQTVLGDELCNGVDDNCDGQVDEGYNVGEACHVGNGECSVEGLYICLDGDAVCDGFAGEGGEELCDNGVDDDCDGLIDETCDPDDHSIGTQPGTLTESDAVIEFDMNAGLSGGCSAAATSSSHSGSLPLMLSMLFVFAVLRRV